MNPTKKLVTVVLPQAVLAEAKSIQKRNGIRTLSSLLRTAIEEKGALKLKPRKEKTRQISFRANTETVDALSRLAKQNKRSLAEIIRILITNVGRLSNKKLSATAEAAKKKTPPKKKKTAAPKRAVAQKSQTAKAKQRIPTKKNASKKRR